TVRVAKRQELRLTQLMVDACRRLVVGFEVGADETRTAPRPKQRGRNPGGAEVLLRPGRQRGTRRRKDHRARRERVPVLTLERAEEMGPVANDRSAQRAAVVHALEGIFRE